jgi:hypothetical protein
VRGGEAAETAGGGETASGLPQKGKFHVEQMSLFIHDWIIVPFQTGAALVQLGLVAVVAVAVVIWLSRRDS